MIGNKILGLKNRLIQEKTEFNLIKKRLTRTKKDVLACQNYYTNTLKAREAFQEAAENIQKTIEIKTSSLVSSALKSVFDDPYEFKMEFTKKRNTTECNLFFERNGKRYLKPLKSSGGGVLDIANFALRIAFWGLNKNRNTIILDEPFRYLSPDLLPKAGQLLQKLSDNLGIQFIIITNLKRLLPYGDKIFIDKGNLRE